ncbi:MAG: PaaX family transcriptional regulator C-terminal domain-containing protein [Acidimicrobiia bacterium]
MRVDRLGTEQRPRRLPATLVGQYGAAVGGWFRLQHQVRLLVELGMHDRAARSAIRRMTESGLLVSENRDGHAGHRITEQGWDRIAASVPVIFNRPTRGSLDDGWLLVCTSIPEAERDRRHRLRSRLERLGLGGMGNGLWVGPSHRCDAVLAAVALDARPGEVDVFSGVYLGQPRALVQRAWDLEITQTMAAAFVRQNRGLLRRKRWTDDAAYVAYTLALHQWRMVPLLDPGLPLEVLPKPWAAEQAADVFLELRDRLEAPAVRYVQAVTTSG